MAKHSEITKTLEYLRAFINRLDTSGEDGRALEVERIPISASVSEWVLTRRADGLDVRERGVVLFHLGNTKGETLKSLQMIVAGVTLALNVSAGTRVGPSS